MGDGNEILSIFVNIYSTRKSGGKLKTTKEKADYIDDKIQEFQLWPRSGKLHSVFF